jgi:SAM-dependent methyltransferase
MDDFTGFKAAQKVGWRYFLPLQATTIVPAARLVKHAGIRSGAAVLDVACGTGVVSITAARLGAQVTGLDLTPELLAAARANATTAAVEVAWHEGDAEQLPFPDSSFDVVVSQFGHIFAPRPDVATAEMLRVLRPGGTIAFNTWPPELFVGRLFALNAKYLPPPPAGVAPPLLWGDPQIVRERLGARVSDIVFDRDTVSVPCLSLGHQRELTESASGPIIRLIESLSVADPAKLAAYRRDYEELAAQYFEGNAMHQGYLITRATKI